MNCITAIQNYIVRMVESVKGMKVLLLDQETMGIISVVFSQSEILQQEVYLFELLEAPNREVMTHLKAICLLRPTPENLFLLTDELRKPKYEEYHLFFTNTLKSEYLEDLAQADEHEVVHQVQEFYSDYFAINPDTFSLNIESCIPTSPSNHQVILDRICDGLGAILLSLRRRPIIRYEKASELAQRTAQELTRRMLAEKTLFDFRRKSAGVPVLLIIDRRSDPVTPLLMQWTYQAMVHEIFTISNNRVKCYNSSSTKVNEIVLSQLQDEFYKENIYSNFGDLAINVKKKVQELSVHAQANQNIQTIEDMKKFIQNYPEYQKLSGNVNKHVSLLQDLAQITGERQLLLLSETEQELATNNDHSSAVKLVTELLSNPKVEASDKLKLLLIYALRYERHSSNQIAKLLGILQQSSGVDQRDANSLIKTLLMYGGDEVRSGDLFGTKSWLAKARNTIKKGLQGATNVYTQHRPLLVEQLTDLVKGKLPDSLYPAMGDYIIDKEKPSDIIVFFVGGATFEEAYAINELKRENPDFANVEVVLGGTTIHNSHSYLQELRKFRETSFNR